MQTMVVLGEIMKTWTEIANNANMQVHRGISENTGSKTPSASTNTTANANMQVL